MEYKRGTTVTVRLTVDVDVSSEDVETYDDLMKDLLSKSEIGFNTSGNLGIHSVEFISGTIK